MTTNPHPYRGYSRLSLALAVLLGASLALHALVASIRHPVGPRFGSSIHGKTTGIEGDSLRVAVWNIRRGKGLDGKRDLERIAEGLADFDIIGLNEVGSGQAEALGEQLGMGWQYTPSQRRWYRDYFGNAFLSRLAPVSWQSQPLVYDQDKGTGHRHLQIVHYRWNDLLFGMIILHAERGPVRDKQIRIAVDAFRRFDYGVLMGDFNADASHPTIASLLDNPNVTSAVDDDPSQIDWLFIRGFDLEAAGIVPPGASDHPLIWAELSPLTAQETPEGSPQSQPAPGQPHRIASTPARTYGP